MSTVLGSLIVTVLGDVFILISLVVVKMEVLFYQNTLMAMIDVCPT